MIQRLQVKRNEKGFTLIELLIVIIVLGILAAIVVFAVGTTRKDAQSASCKTTKSSAELSAEAVKTRTGLYPVGTIDWSTGATSALVSPATGAMLKSWPASDSYGLRYVGVADATATTANENVYAVS